MPAARAGMNPFRRKRGDEGKYKPLRRLSQSASQRPGDLATGLPGDSLKIPRTIALSVFSDPFRSSANASSMSNDHWYCSHRSCLEGNSSGGRGPACESSGSHPSQCCLRKEVIGREVVAVQSQALSRLRSVSADRAPLASMLELNCAHASQPVESRLGEDHQHLQPKTICIHFANAKY